MPALVWAPATWLEWLEREGGGLQTKHLVVQQDGQRKVERCWDAGDEVEGGELPREFLHGEDHLVHLGARE